MLIYAKIGTMSLTRVHVMRKRKAPVVGERFDVRERGKKIPTPVRCTSITPMGKGESLYFLEMF